MKFRLPVLFLTLGLVPFVVGCDEIAKATDNKPEEKAKAQSPDAAEAAKKPKKPAADFADFPTNDPLISNAIEMKDQLAAQEEALLGRLDELRMLLASAKADPARMRQSVDEFLDIAKDMRKVSVQAGESVNAMIETTNELARSSKHLAASYRGAAELFRKKAKDYTERKLRDQLNGFARDYDAIAASIPERIKTLEAFQRKLPKLKVKVREANAFMDDVVLFLSSHPGVGTDSRERYVSHFETFAVTFSEWIATLDEIRKSLREHAVSKAIQDGYRKDVAEWQKVELAKRDEQFRREQAEREEAARLARVAEEQRLIAAERERLAAEREQLAKAQAKAAEQQAARPLADAQPAAAAPAPQVAPSSPSETVVVSDSAGQMIYVNDGACTPMPSGCWTVAEPCRPVYRNVCRYVLLPRPCGCR